MPGNEVEDRICNFFEQDNSSQGHLQSQTVGGSWPVNYNQWVGNQRQIGEAINFNPKNFNVRQLDSVVGPGSESLQVSFDQNHAQVTLRPQFSKSYSRYQQLNSNGLMFGHQNLQTRQNQTEFLGENTCYQYNLTSKGLSNLQLQQKSASEDSPTLTTNSERSETAETPDFNFLGGQQHFIKSQQQVMPQPRPRQPSGFNDIQLVQQHIMFKQLQELQRQQQLQRLGDTKQNNSINQLSTLAKQASGGQFPPLINGTPIHDASQMFMNLVQRGAPPSVQGLPNRLPNTQEQGQAVRSMGLVPQQLDASLYGTPVASARSNMSPYTHLRGMSHDSTSFLANASANQSQKPPMQPSAFSNPFLGIASQEQACMPDGTFIAKHGFQGRNLFGQIPIQDLNSGVISENFHQGNALQRNASVQELNGKQERTGWPGYSQEKVTQMNPSPGLSALDPMEEKILFNMDDNWDASFGKRTDMGTGSCGNAWEHTDYMNTYPSVNSGSWSALMQSAVAEASSSDTGLQEEWSGLTFQNTELSTDNQPSHFMDSAKQETGWVDNNLQSASSLSSKPFPAFNDSNMSSSFPGFQQSGMQFSLESRERMRPDSSHESIQQSPKNAGRWLDCNSQQKQHMEGTQQMQSLTHLETAWGGQIFEQSESSSHRENVSSYNNGSQPCNKPKGGNFQSLSPSGNATLNMGSNENHVGNCWAGDINGAIYKERDPDGCLWKADGNRGASSFSNSTGGLEQVQSGADDTLVNGEDSQINNFAAVPNSICKVDQETNQQVSDGHQLDYMKHVDIAVKHKENENMGKHQHQLNNNLQVLDSSYKGAGEVYDKRQNCFQRENSSDSYNSNASQHTITGREGRENVWLNASDPRTLAGSDQKSSGQVGWIASSSRRFLYHPMGNLGVSVEPADTLKHVTNPQVPCQQVSEGLTSREQGYLGQFQIVANVSNSNMDMEKGNLPDFQGNLKAPEVPSGVSLRSNAFASSDRSGGFYSPNVTIPTSQNMLELLHKVDQTREDSTVTHFGTPDCNPLSRVPEPETPDVSVAQPYNSASQGFGLRLAPPSQRLPNSNHFFSSQGSSQAASNLKVRHVNPELPQKGQTWLASPSSMQSLPPHESSQTGCWDDKSSISGHAGIENSHSNLQGNSPAVFTSGSPYLRNQLQKQLIPNAPVVRQTLQASSAGTAGRLPPFNLAPSQDTSRQIYANSFGQSFPVLEAVPVTQPSIMPGMSQLSGFSARPNNVWTNIPTQRHLSGTEPYNVPSSSLPSTDSSKRNLETPSLAPQELNDQNSQKGGNESLEFGACSMNSQGFDYGEEQPGKERSQQRMVSEMLGPPSQTSGLPQEPESVVKHMSDASAVTSGSVRYKENQSRATSERDFEAFGRSLKPSHTFHQNYFVHQTQAMRNVETDPSKKVSYPLDDELNAESRPRPFPTGEKTMVSFFSAAREDQNVKASSQPVFQDVSSQEMVTFGRQDSQSHSTSTNLAPNPRDSSQINLQMAPSWFKQFGTLRNGQMLSMYDTRIAKTVAEQLSSGKSSENLLVHASVGGVNAADASQVNSVWPSTAAALVESGHLTPPYMLPTDSIDQSLVDMGTKKRKIAFSELLPWHKEVTQDSQRLQNIRMAEREWAQTTNRLIEKVEYEAEVIEDRQPMVRPKRRLILTTQLMQQLLRPAPRAILSADATSDYDCVVYYIAKLALGDACGLSSCARSDLCSSLDNCNMMCEKLKSPERIGDQYFSKVVEGFTGRVKNLENELLRLDKAASILDIKVECQELEKFSVINRFARFHSRGQAGAAETSSASGAAGTVLKSVPQRYVTALPLPSKLPEGVQCLSL